MSPTKTNAMRLLEKANIPFQTHSYDPHGEIDGVSVAKKLAQAPETVYKTLVVVGKSRAHYVFILPAPAHLDLKKAARVCGEKSVDMLPQKELLPLTGYVHGGCSPLGMKKAFPTFIAHAAQALERFCVSAGKIGLQLELSPTALHTLLRAPFADFCSE